MIKKKDGFVIQLLYWSVAYLYLMIINSDPEQDKSESERSSSGSRLCKALIGVYDHVMLKSSDLKNPDRLHAVAALRNLLAVSVTAKETAIQSKRCLI